MEELHTEGSFQGRIASTEYEKDSQNADGVVLVFNVKLDDGFEAPCKHRSHGEWSHITQEILEKLGLPWPKGVARIDETVGRDVPVRIKNKAGRNGGTFQNCYIAYGKSNAPATQKHAARAAALLAGETPEPVDDDDIPF